MDVPLLLAGETTKSVILRILANEWPLSMKKIYFSVKRASKKALTYQAVYKSVKELLGEGVLSKQGNEYLISPVWVEKSGEFIGRLAESYEKSDLSMTKRIQELNFKSLNEN
jgi:predicted transcriptional regulator